MGSSGDSVTVNVKSLPVSGCMDMCSRLEVSFTFGYIFIFTVNNQKWDKVKKLGSANTWVSSCSLTGFLLVPRLQRELA